MSVLRRFSATLDDICRPLIDPRTQAITYKPLQRIVRWILAILNLVGVALCLFVVVQVSLAIARNEQGTSSWIITVPLVVACLGVCCCTIAVVATYMESHRAMVLCSCLIGSAALALLGVSLYYLLQPVVITPLQLWQSLDDSTRQHFQQQDACCGFFDYNDSYAVQPCPPSATTACGSHWHSIKATQEVALEGTGCSAALVGLALLSLLLQRTFRLKHEYVSLQSSDVQMSY